jgi:outer membrane lipoprotein SlyB
MTKQLLIVAITVIAAVLAGCAAADYSEGRAPGRSSSGHSH